MFKESDYLVALHVASHLFGGDEQKAVAWLNKPARAFGGKTPVQVLESEDGVEMITTLVGQIQHGVIV